MNLKVVAVFMALLCVNAAKVVYDGKTVDDQDELAFILSPEYCKLGFVIFKYLMSPTHDALVYYLSSLIYNTG